MRFRSILPTQREHHVFSRFKQHLGSDQAGLHLADVAAVHKVVVPSVHVFVSAGHGKREFVINKRGGDKRFCREVVEPAVARRSIHCWRVARLAGANLDVAASWVSPEKSPYIGRASGRERVWDSVLVSGG